MGDERVRVHNGYSRGSGSGIAAVEQLGYRSDAQIFRRIADAWKASPPRSQAELYRVGNEAVRSVIGRPGASVFPHSGPPGASQAFWGPNNGFGIAVVDGVP